MGDYRLKIKIGDHEFEAEGPADVVQNQFAMFKELLGSRAAAKREQSEEPKSEHPDADPKRPAFDKIMRSEGRVVSLTVHPESVDEAIMVVLLGQRHFRQNDSVTGGEIIDGLRQSGHTVSRVDYQLDRLSTEGSVIKVGTGRASRYRLTNKGLTKAEEIANNFLLQVP
jgi:hypothetical protein